MFQRARIPISIGETVFDERPTIMTRLVVESGWMMTGGLATFGIANDSARRSCTSCRARRTSVPGLEREQNRRQARDGRGMDVRQPRRAVQELLEVERDQILDLGRGQAERLGLDLDHGRRELGQRIHRHLPRLVCAGGQYGSTKRNGEEPEPEARSDDPSQHDGGSPSLSRQPIAG